MERPRALALAATLALAAAGPGRAAAAAPRPLAEAAPAWVQFESSLAAAEVTPPVELTFPEAPETRLEPVAPLPPVEATFIDAGHSLLERNIFWPVVQVDRFFSDQRAVDAQRTTSFLRWRNDLRIHSDGHLGYETSVRADLQFPFLSRRLDRLRLSVAGQTADALDRLLPGDAPLAPAGGRQVSAGLGLTLLESLRVQSEAQMGLLFSWPLGWYARLGLRHAHELGEVGLGRISLLGFWQTNTGWGTREELSLERLLQAWLMARLAGTGTLTERTRGVEWGAEAALFATVNPTTALGLAGGASGASDAGAVVEVWRVTARARRDVWRRWLFLELEPEVTWTLRPTGGRLRAEVVMVRLEVQFQEARTAPKG